MCSSIQNLFGGGTHRCYLKLFCILGTLQYILKTCLHKEDDNELAKI